MSPVVTESKCRSGLVRIVSPGTEHRAISRRRATTDRRAGSISEVAQEQDAEQWDRNSDGEQDAASTP